MQQFMLAKPHLRVRESDKVWTYTRAFSNSGLPYYVAPPEREGLHKNLYINEPIFLPISTREFMTNREDYFYGYRFLFATPGYTTIGLPLNGLPSPLTYVQLSLEATRIRYFMEDDDEHDIVIDWMGDSLFPTRIVEVQHNPENIAAIINDLVLKLIDEYTMWYSERKI